jgi:hypothetical protein
MNSNQILKFSNIQNNILNSKKQVFIIKQIYKKKTYKLAKGLSCIIENDLKIIL